MTDNAPSYIGWWAKRHGGKAHLVESEVTDRLVMRCGRQMRLVVNDWGFVFERDPSPETGWERCEQCMSKYVKD